MSYKNREKDYNAVILERMHDDIKVIAEGQIVLREEMNRRFDERKKDFDDFKEETRGNFRVLFEFKKETEENFEIVFKELSFIEAEIKDIKNSLKILEKNKADIEVVKDLIERVEKLEKELALQRELFSSK